MLTHFIPQGFSRASQLTTRCALLCLALTAATTARAQQPSLAIEEVLTHTRENAAAYRASIPNVSADEDRDSKVVEDGKTKKRTTVQSSFRTVRNPQNRQIHESRTIHFVDGKPSHAKGVELPYSFSGGVSDLLHSINDPCIEFHFASSDATPNGSIVLVGTSRPALAGHPTCGAQKVEVHAILENSTFQVLHLETIVRDVHFNANRIQRMFGYFPSDHNAMATTVSYAPVALGISTFYLPTKVESSITDTAKPLKLSYEATYSNYHLYTATATIRGDEPSQDSQ